MLLANQPQFHNYPTKFTTGTSTHVNLAVFPDQPGHRENLVPIPDRKTNVYPLNPVFQENVGRYRSPKLLERKSGIWPGLQGNTAIPKYVPIPERQLGKSSKSGGTRTTQANCATTGTCLKDNGWFRIKPKCNCLIKVADVTPPRHR